MRRPRVLIGYSCDGATRQAFEDAGCDAWTCDILPARDGHEKHLRCHIRVAVRRQWDGAVLHPMCTFLTVAAAWAFNDPDYDRYPDVGYHQRVKPGTLTGQARRDARDKAVGDVKWLEQLPFPTAIENPGANFLSNAHRKPDQLIHPHQFGNDASKLTGLWLRGFPPLQGTSNFPGRLVEWPKGSGKMVERWSNQTDSGQNNVTPSESRWLDRSETYPGIAAAMGAQWGQWLIDQQNEGNPYA